MRLIAFSLQGYRRFASKTSVKLHGGLVAFVGPNEAGKSSLLRALAHLHNDKPFEPSELPRRTNLKPQLTWHFQLEDNDKAALVDISGAQKIERVAITKNSDGNRTWQFEPCAPVRDRSKRSPLAALLQEYRILLESKVIDEPGKQDSNFSERYDEVIAELASDIEDYPDSVIEKIKSVATAIDGIAYPAPDPTDDDLINAARSFQAVSDQVVNDLQELIREESAVAPRILALNLLKDKLPSIQFFAEVDRDLASEYDLTEVAKSPPRALMHLAFLAGLDLQALLREVEARAIADVATRRNAANKELLEAFDKGWNQQGIAIQFDIQGTILHIQATTPEDSGLSDISDRSDGMRWFAALLAFTYGWESDAILLVDEIERHLHYDAQADLISVLTRQVFTSKIIYTTHSFGCLPYDLGTGVRVVHPVDSATSRLENGFWKKGIGFSPLLACMGAAAMSFTPTRYAVIAEGPADAILLPTLLRQASDESNLRFQVAPGLSGVAAQAVPELDSEAGRVAFIVDGDSGGKQIASKLRKNGVSPDRIVMLEDEIAKSGLEIEDFIDSGIYAQAVMEELRCWGNISDEYTQENVSQSLRTKGLEPWCEKHGYTAPEKVAVAQRVVDMASDRSVYNSERLAKLKEIYGALQTALKLV